MENGDETGAPRTRGARFAALVSALLLAVPAAALLAPPAATAAFGFKATAMSFEAQDESPATLAGSHPFAWRTTVLFDPEDEGSGGLKDLQIQVPPGLSGTPRLLPECEHSDFILNACPDSTALGVLALQSEGSFNGGPTAPILVQAPVFNLEPLPGNGAEFGSFPEAFNLALPLSIEIGISSTYPQRLIASLTNVSQVVSIRGYQLTLWGDPTDPAHDPYRGACGAAFELGQEGFVALSNGSCTFSAGADAPFLTLPSSCAAAAAAFEANFWSAPTAPITALLAEALKPSGCGALSYTPTLHVAPTTIAASAPSGLDLDLDAADPGIASASGRAAADTAAATLVLPAGMSANPPLAAGLLACSPAQLTAEGPDPDPATGCPAAAKIGTATVTTPLFAQPIVGSIYVATPHDNPFASLLALYLVLRDPERGVLLSLPIRVDAEPVTGRLTASFEQIPQLPFSHLALRFSSGPHAPLATPPRCGKHAIDYELEPSSGNPPLAGSDAFATSLGCESSFAPTLQAGTASYAAGSEAPFVLEVANAAPAPNLESLTITLPPGLAANLNAAATCPEAAACPPDSRLGYARIALGAGPEPLWVPSGTDPDSDVFLAGPYRGAPYSLLISVPAEAGPYDLGRVVLRAPVRIDPASTQATVELTGLPQIRDGIPLHYRALRLVLDRPGFIRNPTSCEPTQITGTAISSSGETASLASRFQAADCAALPFKPSFALHLSGALARNGHPALRAVLRAKPAQANIARAALTLPLAELLDYARIRKTCSPARYASGSGGGERCPARSIYGQARVFTPLLDEPLEGPVYLRSNDGERQLPDLVASLSGRTHLDLVAHLSPVHGLVRAVFVGVPDLPLSRLVLRMRGGKRGLLVNTTGLCRASPRARAAFLAHNGKRHAAAPAAKVSCGSQRP